MAARNAGSSVLNIGHKAVVLGLTALTGSALYMVGSGAATIIGRRMDRSAEQKQEAADAALLTAAHKSAVPAAAAAPSS